MTPKSFTVFAAVTVATVVAAVVAVGQRPDPVRIPTDRELVFPKVGAALNDVAVLKIDTPGRTFTIKREGDRWGIDELKGLPVQFDKVKTVLVELSQLRFLEPKTSDPERYERLELQDVTAKGAKSKHISVLDAKGTVLAAAHLGKRNANLFGTGRGGTYLRVDGSKQTWLAEGTVSLGEGPADWISKRIVDLKATDVKKLTILSPKGGGVVIERAKKEDKDFKLADIPPGKKQRGQWETNQMPTALEALDLVDIRLAEEITFPDGPYKGSFVTFDGLEIRTEAAQVGKKYWARFSASGESVSGPEAEKVKKFVEEFNQRVRGYVYEVPEAVGKKLACEHRNLLDDAGVNACT